MQPLSDITKLGFKRWYERQLIEAFVYLVTALLSAVLMLAVLERVELIPVTLSSLGLIATAFVAGGIAFVAGRRFLDALSEAEQFGGKSSCPGCGTYAKFDVVSLVAGSDTSTLEVACRKCHRHWHMP